MARRDTSEGPPPVIDEWRERVERRRAAGRRLAERGDRVAVGELVDVVRHRPLLEALLAEPRNHAELRERLDVSRATSHRYGRWLTEQGLASRGDDGRFALTGEGELVAEELLRFERNVSAARRLAPLLDRICETHREFLVEPFADADVTTASPSDPYAPMERFVELLADAERFRGFNTTAMAPTGLGPYADLLFERTESEVIHLPETVERLFGDRPERARAAVERGHLQLLTRDALPYGLAIFDDRVGVGGYDEETGTLRVFVETESETAREWADRVYEAYAADSEPLADELATPDG